MGCIVSKLKPMEKARYVESLLPKGYAESSYGQRVIGPGRYVDIFTDNPDAVRAMVLDFIEGRTDGEPYMGWPYGRPKQVTEFTNG